MYTRPKYRDLNTMTHINEVISRELKTMRICAWIEGGCAIVTLVCGCIGLYYVL